eukprot:2234813-Amphidinium_carterae.2
MLAEHSDPVEVQRVERTANLWVVKALDHALLVGLGRGLEVFKVSKPAEKLEEGQRRFKVVPGSGVPPELFSAGQHFRWAILDTTSKRTHIELSSSAPATLHICTDQGTVGYQAGFWMMQASGLSCTWKCDIHHRIHNDVKAAVRSSQLVVPQLAASAVFNLGAGPWSNNAYQNLISTAAREYFAIATVDEPLFQMHFDLLARDLTDGETRETQSHMESVLAKMKECSALWHYGASTQSSRWFAWYDRAAAYLQSWHAVLVVLTYYCSRRGWIKTPSEIPVLRGCTLTEVLAGDVDVAVEEGLPPDEPSTKARSSAEALKQLTTPTGETVNKSRHRIHMAALLMGNAHVRNQVCMMAELVAPLRAYHGQLVKKLHSSEGSLEHAMLDAAGNWEEPLTQIFAKWESETCLSWMGFKVSERCVVEQEEEEELELARDVFVFTTSLVGERLVQSLSSSFSLPQRMAPLLSDQESVRHQTLQCLQRWFEVLVAIEQKSSTSKALQHIHWEQIWANSHFCRWLLFSLSETNFEFVPAQVSEALLHHFTGIQHTQCVENMFHHIREEESHSTNHQIQRMKRWGVCMQRGSLDDRPNIESMPSESCQHKSLPKTLFSADAAQGGSLDSDHLQRLCTEWWWCSPNPASQALLPLTWMAVLHLWPDEQALENAWYSLLCVPGTMIRHREKNIGGLVVKVSPYGVITWQFLAITEPSEWQALSVRLVPPRIVKRNPYTNQPVHTHMALEADGPRMSALQMSALHCFPGLTTIWLRKLLLSPSVGVAKAPRLEKECLDTLLRHCLPKHRDEDLAQILQQRGSYHTTKPESCEADATAAGEFEGVLDEDDMVMLRTALRKQREQTAVKSAVLVKSASSKRLPLPPVPEGRTSYSLEVLRTLIPQVEGCKITVETHWHTRYRGHYAQGNPRSTSKCWGEKVTEKEAALHVVRWLWSRHAHFTGEQVPYDLGLQQ